MMNPLDTGAFVVSWSGGKDSAMALYLAIRAGMRLSWLFTMVTPEGVTAAHGLPVSVIRQQARAIGLPLVTGTADWGTYEAEFKRVLSDLKRQGATGCIFGDIDLEEHRQWCVRTCSEVGLEAVHPLWGMKQEEILQQFVDAGFEAVIVALNSDKLGRSLVGKRLDREIVREMIGAGITPCGELGEYHTLVVGGPIMKGEVRFDLGAM